MFHLKWDNKKSCPSFSDIRELNDLMDVRLMCGEEEVGAHRVVLAACSPKLRTVLSRLSHHQHPVIYFWGMDISMVKALLTFMYHGEVNIAQGEIQSFLKLAEELEVKGLTTKSAFGEEKEARSERTERTERLDSNSNCQELGSFAERVASWNILKLNDYIESSVGTKQQFLKEDFVRKVMMAVKEKEIDMKGAAELLGVSYATLYGRYTASFGSLKQNVKTPVKVQLEGGAKKNSGEDSDGIAQKEEARYADTLIEVPSENIVSKEEQEDQLDSLVGLVHYYYNNLS